MNNTTLKNYFVTWDPMHFIAEGAPTDEYDQEVSEVISRYRSEMNQKEVSKMVHDVFVELMEIDPDGFAEECTKRADEIRKILAAS